VQWCSKPLLEGSPKIGADGRRIHMHLLETHFYQRAWADANFPDGNRALSPRHRFLSERLTLAHGIHAAPTRSK